MLGKNGKREGADTVVVVAEAKSPTQLSLGKL
jgi:hypothetical protein